MTTTSSFMSTLATLAALVASLLRTSDFKSAMFFFLCVHRNGKSDFLHASVNQQNHLSLKACRSILFAKRASPVGYEPLRQVYERPGRPPMEFLVCPGSRLVSALQS